MKYYKPYVIRFVNHEGGVFYRIKQQVTPNGMCVIWTGSYEIRANAQKEIDKYMEE